MKQSKKNLAVSAASSFMSSNNLIGAMESRLLAQSLGMPSTDAILKSVDVWVLGRLEEERNYEEALLA